MESVVLAGKHNDRPLAHLQVEQVHVPEFLQDCIEQFVLLGERQLYEFRSVRFRLCRTGQFAFHRRVRRECVERRRLIE